MKNEALAELVLDVYRPSILTRKAGTVEYQITEFPSFRVLAIAGSNGWKDWAMNLRFIPIYSPTLGWVHPGFYWGAKKLFNKEKKTLLDGKPTLIVCHSKGAGEGTDVGGFMIKGGVIPAGLLLFGAPRAGFKGLKEILATVHKVRPVNSDDIVTNVPPKGIFVLRYRHVCDPLPTNKKKFKGHDMSIYRDSVKNLKDFFPNL